MRGHHAHRIAQPFQLNARDLADGAPAVTPQEVLRSHGICLSGVAHLDLCGDAFGVLAEAGELVTETDVSAKFLSPLFEQRLKAHLRKVCRSERTSRDEVGIG